MGSNSSHYSILQHAFLAHYKEALVQGDTAAILQPVSEKAHCSSAMLRMSESC